MATRLKNIVRFTSVAAGATVALPHGLNIDPPGGAGGSEPQIPDLVLPQKPGFTVTADATNVTVTNNTAVVGSIDVYVETWHTIERAFGPASQLELVPRPFVVDLSGASANGANAVLGFGAGAISGPGQSDDYLWPWFDQDAQDEAGEGGVAIEMIAPRAGTLRSLYVLHNAPVVAAVPITYTVYKNGVATALTCIVNSNAAQNSDLVNSVLVAAGDHISMRAAHTLALGETGSVAPLEIVATMRFDD